MAVRKLQEEYTIEDVLNLPNGERAELINGQIYMMAPPLPIHQRLSMFFSKVISNYIDFNKGNCEVYAAPFGVYLNGDDKTYVEPDISVICDKNKIDENKGCVGAPDWIIEIVSKSNSSYDYVKKLNIYSTAKVREYWIVEPNKKHVLVHNFERNESEMYSFNEYIPVGIYKDFKIRIEQS